MPHRLPWAMLAEFTKALSKFRNVPDVQEVVRGLIERVLQNPRGAKADDDGVRVVKTPRYVVEDRVFAAIRLTYEIGLRPATTKLPREIIIFLDVEEYDDFTSLKENPRGRSH